MGYTIERTGLVKLVPDSGDTTIAEYEKCLFYQLWKDMQTGGFEVLKQWDSSGNPTTDPVKTLSVLLQPTSSVDPLSVAPSSENPAGVNMWRIYMTVSENVTETITTVPQEGSTQTSTTIVRENRKLTFYYGTPEQIKINAANKIDMVTGVPSLDLIPSKLVNTSVATDIKARVSPDNPAIYRLTIAPRGFALIIQANPLKFSNDMEKTAVVVIQRGVGCSGAFTSTGKKPLFLFTNVPAIQTYYGNAVNPVLGPRTAWYYQIIREESLISPFPEWAIAGNTANAYTDDKGFALLRTSVSDRNERLNSIMRSFPIRWYAPVTTDTLKYLLIFPYGFSSAKFSYADELDLIAVSKADAFATGQSVPIDVYGETRTYTAYTSNNDNVDNAFGVRVFILTESASSEVG